jgi:hypothetical protein
MSAIECKIIICGTEASSVSQASIGVVDDLAKWPHLRKKVISIQEDYVSKMHKALGELTDDR